MGKIGLATMPNYRAESERDAMRPRSGRYGINGRPAGVMTCAVPASARLIAATRP